MTWILYVMKTYLIQDFLFVYVVEAYHINLKSLV